MMRVVAIVQARTGSKRLPNKVLKPIGGVPMLQLLLRRLGKAQYVEQIVVATSTAEADDALAALVRSWGLHCVQGSEQDVLERYYNAAKEVVADIVIRITGDCPFVDPELVDLLVQEFIRSDVDYLSNVDPPSFPDGLDIEIFRFSALEEAWRNATDLRDREHVTPYIRRTDTISKKCYVNTLGDLSGRRWTVDEADDFVVAQNVFNYFSPDIDFSWRDILRLEQTKPELFRDNQHLIRNEGVNMSAGQKLWKRAKQVIPGGNMLLSKRPEMFLPEQWPAYFSKAKGCTVWDLDGTPYIDMSIMGVGTNVLGYGHAGVDEAVRSAITNGNMSTLNCPEEVYLAEKLIELHPWADMARFARSGGEANAIAIRIARAASGRDNVAVCGYHGWHDWYLSANLGDDETLAGHLLPGLEPRGVPSNLRGTVYPFSYNNYEQLEDIVRRHNIGVIKMEVSRNKGPENGFLQKVRELATRSNAVLIFDECTSGFRQSYGGLHLLYGVEPDMAMFGKALGNGYAITGTIGRREIMEAAQSTFISSTFWTERIGPSAALKTLEVMKDVRSWEKITEMGLYIRKQWQEMAEKHSIEIEHWGLPALTGFTISGEHSLAYKTLISQEMLKKGYLAGTSVYVSTEHSKKIVDTYLEHLDSVFGLIKECQDGRDLSSLLEGPVCHAGFKRLN